MIKNYSHKGWRVYVIPNFLKIGQRRMALLEQFNNIEFLVQGDLVYVKDKYEHEPIN